MSTWITDAGVLFTDEDTLEMGGRISEVSGPPTGVFVYEDFSRPSSGVPPTLAVDFDGVIAQYDGWKGKGVFGPPMKDVQPAMRALRDSGVLVIIFTTRGEVDEVAQYCHDNGITFDFINRNPFQPAGTSGKIMADIYLDDRGLRFEDWKSAFLQIIKIFARKVAG